MFRVTDTVKHLIIINILFFVAKISMPELMDRLFSIYYFENPNFKFWQPLTSMFMHADLRHIAFNMIALFFFGPALEQQWGKMKFLFFYLSAGLGADLLSTGINYYHFQTAYNTLIQIGLSATDIQSILTEGSFNTVILDHISNAKIQNFYDAYHSPSLGASGAISGVMVAFAMYYPNREIMLMFVPIPIKAKYFVTTLVMVDVFSGFTGINIMSQGNVGHWAHVGGALFGFIMAYYWKKNSFNNRRWD